MYETESNNIVESQSEIPREILSSFGALKGKLLARTLLPWSEHCTECVWPTCYATCELYEPRKDMRCRRFVDGMVRVECPESVNSYLLKIRFKRWGKLWTPGNLRLFEPSAAIRRDARDYRIGRSLYQIQLPSSLKRTLTTKRYSFKKRVAQRSVKQSHLPTSFTIECFNPQDEVIQLSVVIRPLGTDPKIPYEQLLHIGPGFARVRIPFENISHVVDLDLPFTVELIPNDFQDGMTLYFGVVDFLREAVPVKSKKIKCVVWDLDNTLWDGVLMEDGPDNLVPRAEAIASIKELDRRGILHSIASKNNPEPALKVLRELGLDEYFLYPQISWGPKSDAMKAIARVLNIGLDTLLFVDDSVFEIQQVQSACPEVRVMNANDSGKLPQMEEFDVPITEEAAGRRKLYKVDADRQEAAQSFGQDYLGFLKQSQMKLNIRSLSESNFERVHELTQRTNQMNFSGNRYDKQVLEAIRQDPDLDTYVLDCEDRFGKYGVVGFSIVDRREPRMTDLMFSCRVQSKRVEHAFLFFLIKKYTALFDRDFLANYKKTERNAPAGRVFTDLGMQELGTVDGVSLLKFPKDQTPHDDNVVSIGLETDPSIILR
jgi:FkbH-like protein